MKVAIIGTGYVGLVTGACLAEMGNLVVCVDVDEQRIKLLNDGGLPIHEPGLHSLVQRNTQVGRLKFTNDAEATVLHGELIILGVGTPPDEDGSADLQHVLAAARSIGAHMQNHKVVVDKSTVPVGTAERVRTTIQTELDGRGLALSFSVVSNPEFLKEGAAVDDFMRPDRIIIGADDANATHVMRTLYAPFTRNHDRLLVMDLRSAEFTKYAANAMLATRISFMNELALLAERVGADIEMVRRGIGSDPRIGTQFLYPGIGYGGSCFPKDVKALIRTAYDNGLELGVLKAVEKANERQKKVLIDKVVARFGEDLRGCVFCIWGLAFKPETDDMREAPSLVVIGELVRRGAFVQAYDPVAMPHARRVLSGKLGISFMPSKEAALVGADALLIVTEWREFRSPDFEGIRQTLRVPLIIDGRNMFEPAAVRAWGIEYSAIGRLGSSPAAVVTPGAFS